MQRQNNKLDDNECLAILQTLLMSGTLKISSSDNGKTLEVHDSSYMNTVTKGKALDILADLDVLTKGRKKII